MGTREEGSFSVDSTIYTLEVGAKGTDNLDIFTVEQKRVIARFLTFMVSVGRCGVCTECIG